MKNLRKGKIDKLIYKASVIYCRVIKIINETWYIKSYRKLLKSYGMDIYEDIYYIDPSAYFDNYDYSKIKIGAKVTISRDVLILTHDFSVSKGLTAIGADHDGYFFKGIIIGENCFIGARAVILPGTSIGDNCIIGAGSVVKGNIPSNSIVIGNPCKVIGNTLDWGRHHLALKDYVRV